MVEAKESSHIMAIKKDHDLLIATLEDIMTGEMTPTERVNALSTLKKHADICHNQLSVFKIESKDDLKKSPV